MTSYDHFKRLLVMIGLVIGGAILTAFATIGLLYMAGYAYEDILEMQQSGTLDISAGLTRALLFAQHLLTFILPGIAFGLIYYGSKYLSGLDLAKLPSLFLSMLAIFFLIAAYPLVTLGFQVNEMMPLPSWASDLENQAEDTMKAILDMDTPWIFIANLFIIAILAGIGEELIFRGILQKQIGLLFKSPVMAIWISAFIFSAIHLQFEGFLPRMILGVVLGYLYYWTQNLWVPIIAHAFNNGIQVAFIYATGLDVTSFDETSSDQLQWWMLLLSIGIMYLLYNSIIKYRRQVEYP